MRRPTYTDLYREAISRGHSFAKQFLKQAISLSKNPARPLKLTNEQLQDAHEMLALVGIHPGERYREAAQADFSRCGVTGGVTH